MPTAYMSNLLPLGFIPKGFVGELSTKNGKLATASVPMDIASNLHWLGICNTDLINFLHKQQVSKTTTSKIRVTPFAQYIELFFLVWSRFSGDFDTDPSFVKVTCPDTSFTRTVSLIAGGEESAAKAGESNIPDTQWIAFRGINENLTANDPGAIKVLDAQSRAWNMIDIEVETSPKTVIYTGFYRVKKPHTNLIVTT